MAATVQVSESNGAVATVTDGISNMNFGSADVANLVSANHPLPQLTSGGGQSYTKWLRIHLVALGGSTQIANLKVWKSSGTYVAGEIIGSNTAIQSPAASYTVTTYGHACVGGGGGAIAMPYAGTGGAILGGNTYAGGSFGVLTSAPAATNLTIAGSNSGVLNAAGYSDYGVFAETYTSGTPNGAVNQKVFTWQYDET